MIATGFNLRFHPSVRTVKEHIGGHNVINAVFILSQKRDGLDDAMLWPEWGSHEIDLARYLCGDPATFLGVTQHGFGYGSFYHAVERCSTVVVDAKGDPEVRQFRLLLSDGKTVSVDLTSPRVSEQDYKDETWAFLRSVETEAIEPPLATGADGLIVAKICGGLL
jgi:hypothetical protein